MNFHFQFKKERDDLIKETKPKFQSILTRIEKRYFTISKENRDVNISH